MLRAERYEAAAYLSGYAVELALNARFCRSVDWTEFPSTTAEFNAYRSLRTHDLEVLLHLSGREVWIRQTHLAAWTAVTAWSAELRYTDAGSVRSADAQRMVEAVEKLLEVL
ncbi:MAG TPA: hypothetical protein VFV75_12800 [Candidatus Polarisedimenticolaceae bacterium]|nr:hypothetical protein [Candidatus Polarisedimenticolaceae bacterium]